MKSIKLKIKRHTYTITEDDVFIDNGACVQLSTQSKEHVAYGRMLVPKLSKASIKQINQYQHKTVSSHGSGSHKVEYFSLILPDTKCVDDGVD